MTELLPVLVVDDDPHIRQLLGAVLRRYSIDCQFAADGEEVLEMLRMTRYSVVLLDLMMPYVDGIGVIEQMKAMGDPTPIVVITAAGASVIDRVDRSMVAQIFTKPFNVYDVAEKVVSLATDRSDSEPPPLGLQPPAEP